MQHVQWWSAFTLLYFTLHYIIALLYFTSHHITLQYITLHYLTLRYITLHHITSHYITLYHNTTHYITLHHITLHHITTHHITLHYITSHHITSQHITLHYITLHCTIVHYSTLHNISLHYITMHYITLQYSTLHWVTLSWCQVSYVKNVCNRWKWKRSCCGLQTFCWKETSTNDERRLSYLFGSKHLKLKSLGTKNWFKANAFGINKINSLTKIVAQNAGLDNSSLRNHIYSGRKTMIQSLGHSDVPPTHIVQLTGHKDLKSL